MKYEICRHDLPTLDCQQCAVQFGSEPGFVSLSSQPAVSPQIPLTQLQRELCLAASKRLADAAFTGERVFLDCAKSDLEGI